MGKSSPQVGFSGNGGGITIGGQWKGIGGSISYSPERGIGASGGIGILDVEYHADGTGSVGWGFGIYEMRVSRNGCNYVKDFYIGGIYTHTEYQRDEKCDDFPDKDKGESKETEDKIKRRENDDQMAEMPEVIPDPERFTDDTIVIAVMSWVYSLGSGDTYRWICNTGEITQMWDPSDWKIPNFPYTGLFTRCLTTQECPGVTEGRIEDNRAWRMVGWDGSFVDYKEGTGTTATELLKEGFFPPVVPGMIEDYFTGYATFGLGYFRAGPAFFRGRYKYFRETWGAYVGAYKWVRDHEKDRIIFYWDWAAERSRQKKMISVRFYTEEEQEPRRLSPPTPRQKEMDCCDKLDKRLKRIEATINTDLFIDENGVKIPKNLFIPGGRGDTEIKNYADYLATIIRIQAQSGIFPFSIEKKDINLVRSGNQSQTYYLPTATEAMKAVLENTIDNEIKNDAILNLSVRIGIMVSKIVGKITFIEKTVQAISDFLGYPRREKVARERIEVDPTLGARKQVGFRGFGPAPRNTNRKIEKQIELIRKKLEEGDKSLESALEDFLHPDDVAVRYEDFDDESGAPDLMELIDKGR